MTAEGERVVGECDAKHKERKTAPALQLQSLQCDLWMSAVQLLSYYIGRRTSQLSTAGSISFIMFYRILGIPELAAWEKNS